MTISIWIQHSELTDFFKVINLLENNIYVLREDLQRAKSRYTTRPCEDRICLNISINHYFEIENA